MPFTVRTITLATSATVSTANTNYQAVIPGQTQLTIGLNATGSSAIAPSHYWCSIMMTAAQEAILQEQPVVSGIDNFNGLVTSPETILTNNSLKRIRPTSGNYYPAGAGEDA